MLEEPRHNRAALDEDVFKSLVSLEAFEILQATPAPALTTAASSIPKGSIDPRWTAHAMLGCVAAVLLALLLAPAHTPMISGEISRLRVRSLFSNDPEAAFVVAERLLMGRGSSGKPARESVGIPALLARVGIRPPLGQDTSRAAAWYRRAAEQGHLKATIRYAQLLERKGDPKAAYPWFRQAADAGHPSSMHSVASALRFGMGVQRDLRAAADWYQRAADAGDEGALVNLAIWLSTGRGIQRDPERAHALLEQAAELGSAFATKELARLAEASD